VTLDAFASMPHYADHLRPIWDALPAELRGTFWRAGAMMRDQPGAVLPRGRLDAVGPVVMVAGAADRNLCKGRQVILAEHGAGQRYVGVQSASYSGGPGWDRCRLFLCPNDDVAARWREAYPATPAVVVGCPRLDRWHRPLAGCEVACGPERVVALTFHWDNRLVPETTWALPHYQDQLPVLRNWLAGHGYQLVGHGHPRAQGALQRVWRRLEIPFWPSFDQVAAGAQVLVGDNTSALPEFASLGRPVVWLNAPWYRRNVHHGGRFWSWPEGQPTCDERGELCEAVARGLNPLPAEARSRAAMVAAVYAATDGHAADRAAAAVCEVL